MGGLKNYLNPDGKFKDEYAFANNWTMMAAINENKTGESGLYACILDVGDARILAMRGSEEMNKIENWDQDWFEGDLKLLNSEMTKQEEALRRFMESNATLLSEKPWVATGHSLGGALADFAAVMSVVLGIEHFAGATNFDGPGHSQEFIEKYKKEIALVAPLMVHKRASFVGSILFDLPGVRQEFVETKDKIDIFAEHDVQNWVRNKDGSLREGKQDWYEFLVEKLTRGIDRLPSILGNALPYIVNLIAHGAFWLRDFANDHPALIQLLTTAVAIFLAGNPTLALAAIAIVAAIVVVVGVVLLAVIIGEIIIEIIEKIIEAIAAAVSVAIAWLADKAVELFNAIKDIIGAINEWFRNTFNAGARYANSNPYFKVDTALLRNYATRIDNVNKRLRNLDGNLQGLYWQVGLLDIKDIFMANLLTSGSPTLNQIVNYLDNAANRLESAEDKAREYMGGK